MENTLIRFDSLVIYSFSLVMVLAYLWGSFVFYKKALEARFEETLVLDAIVMSAFWSVILGRILFVLFNYSGFDGHLMRIFFLKDYPGLSLWGVLLGIALANWILVKGFKLKFIDWFDLMILGLVGGLPVFLAGLTILVFKWQYLVMAVVAALVFGFFWKAEDEYRMYSWYRGKKTHAKSGLISGFGLVFFGLVGIVMEAMGSRTLREILMNSFLIVGGLVMVYIRSGRMLSEDIKTIKNKYGRKK